MKPVEVVLAIVLITLALEITSRYTHCFEFLIYRLFIHQWPGVGPLMGAVGTSGKNRIKS